MTEILDLINNLDTVDLLDPDTINLISWEPSLPPRRESVHVPIYDNGSTLISSQFDNIVETFTFSIAGNSQDNVITNLRNLTSILEAAKAYYIGLKSTPTYLRAKANNETGTRYAIVKNYKLEKLSQVLGPTPFGSSGMKVYGQAYPAGLPQIVLVLELDLWRSQAPGSYDTVLAANYETFDSNVYGTVDSLGDPVPVSSVFIANKYNKANLNRIYKFDTSGSAYTLISSYPVALFPSPIGVGDILYVGSGGVTDSGPFNNVAFNLTTVATAAMTIAWEYWDGATWSSLSSVYDGTSGFSASGQQIITFSSPSDWSSTSVNGVSAFWARARITNLNGNSTSPVQSEGIYTATWPFIEIQDDQVGGDIPALARYLIRMLSYSSLSGKVIRLIMGMRSVSRGSDFIPIWNASDEQNPSGVTFTAHFGVAISSESSYPTGRIVDDVTLTSSGGSTKRVTWSVSSTYAGQYVGRFRVFLTYVVTGTTGSPSASDINLQMVVSSPDSVNIGAGQGNANQYSTEYASPESIATNIRSCVDLGEIVITGPEEGEDVSNPIEISLRGFCSSGMTVDIKFVNISLVPVDEWSCEISSKPPFSLALDPTPVTEMNASRVQVSYLDIDGTKKKNSVVISRETGSDSVRSIPIYNSVSPPFLQANSTQRIFFLIIGEDARSHHNVILKITPSEIKRYLSLRGSD